MQSGLKIAVADDEVDMRDYFQKMLPLLGHQVVSVAATGQELVDNCRRNPPDLVITDVAMPGSIDGLTLARRLRETRPDLPIVLMSGYAEGTLSGEVVSENFLFLQKPFRISDMLTQIAGALTRR